MYEVMVHPSSLLCTPATSCLIRADGVGALRHLHSGPRLNLEHAFYLPATAQLWLNGDDDAGEDEGEGGLWCGAAGPRVESPADTRGLEREQASKAVRCRTLRQPGPAGGGSPCRGHRPTKLRSPVSRP
jgi:hypothetical protein